MSSFMKGAAIAAIAMMSGSAGHAAVTVYTSASQFAAAVAIQHQAGFEGLPYGRSYLPFTQDGITFTALGQDFYIVSPGQALTKNPATFPTAALSADGDENFQFNLASGASFAAIGLDYATNAYGAPVLSLYGPGGLLIGDYTVTVPPETVGFFGLVSTTPIAYARSIVDRGYIADTAIDNVRIGVAADASPAPEPVTWCLMALGFGAVGSAIRYRRTTVVLAV